MIFFTALNIAVNSMIILIQTGFTIIKSIKRMWKLMSQKMQKVKIEEAKMRISAYSDHNFLSQT